MMAEDTVAVILPALNEADCMEKVVHDFLATGSRVIVVDNGSVDGTGIIAERAGAEVVYEGIRGYGSACLAGLSYLSSHPPEIVVFADCDGTLESRELPMLIAPIRSEKADLVLGRRARVEGGAFPLHQRFGNSVTCLLLHAFYGLKVRDIPPYRAARWSFVKLLDLREKSYGLPIETLALAARKGGTVTEVDVAYHRRVAGESKVAGSLSSSLRAGLIMIMLTVMLRLRRLRK
jgi:glycosyltransferase involved in cell wall biosynthesis